MSSCQAERHECRLGELGPSRVRHSAERTRRLPLDRPAKPPGIARTEPSVTAEWNPAGRPDAGSANPADGGSGPDGLRDLGHLVHDLEKVGELIGWGSRTDFD